ncbi:MAG: hypothetical protein ACAI43_13020 [Phycisphaerae bacterium]|nr:hypothetical protein [Tepidisphaeraceae bacterium]
MHLSRDRRTSMTATGRSVALALGMALLVAPCLAGRPTPWNDVPKPVRDTVLANGGKEGPVDRESEVRDGKAVYEAQVRDKDGAVKDLVITEDGKLVETKTDDAADAAAERVARARRVLEGVKFTRPTEITHPFLPLSSLKQDVLEGNEGGKKTRIVRTVRRDLTKTFKIDGRDVPALVMEDRDYEDGKLSEVTLDYFAQDDAGNVYYLGEDVDEYRDGKVVGHDGAWLFGKDTPVPGVLLPATPKVGDKFRSEDVSNEISEKNEVVSISETVKTPAGEYRDCVKVKESLADGTTEYKYYAKGVGVVRETPHDGDELLASHETVAPTPRK